MKPYPDQRLLKASSSAPAAPPMAPDHSRKVSMFPCLDRVQTEPGLERHQQAEADDPGGLDGRDGSGALKPQGVDHVGQPTDGAGDHQQGEQQLEPGAPAKAGAGHGEAAVDDPSATPTEDGDGPFPGGIAPSSEVDFALRQQDGQRKLVMQEIADHAHCSSGRFQAHALVPCGSARTGSKKRPPGEERRPKAPLRGRRGDLEPGYTDGIAGSGKRSGYALAASVTASDARVAL